jgi:acyl-CoA carboxylase epsilon subunit
MMEAAMDEATDTDAGPATMMSVVRGEPTPEEIAALVAVIAGRAAAAAAGAGSRTNAPVSGWTDRSRYVQGQVPHSTDGWRASALPR